MRDKLRAAQLECGELATTMKGRMVMATIGPLVGMLFALLRAMVSEIEELKRRQGDGGR